MQPKQQYRILITSNEPWGDIWFSKQHYANELSKLGHEVYFINAPTGWSIGHLFSNKIQINPIKANLYTIDYNNKFPLRGSKKIALRLNDSINERKIYKALPPSNLPILWWKFDPFRFVHLSPSFNRIPVKEIYHITDPFDHIFSDPLLAQKADLVVTVLQRYQSYYQKLNKKAVLYIPHGISSDEFELDERTNQSYNKFKGSILKIGTINDYYNIELLIAIAQTFKHKKLVLVGPNKLTLPAKQEQFKALEKLDNVFVEGAQKASLLKYYVSNSDVCIVPYDFNIESLKGTPLKVLNYLAQGKVSITSIATDLEHLIDKGLVKSTSKEHFIKKIQAVLAGEIVIDQAYLDAFFASVSYPFLIEQILTELELRNSQ
ncbi:MAG: Unknown protein [uncultured Aureispira sp.]|uniref:Glycosyltransferase n=1 Tax=uncultured Aureispira sp. TaxID=1331704 RepID=A0A6S6TFJ1_9BACT|nr:MAG: Unknown protein [uncultured Aureispira sp.]